MMKNDRKVVLLIVEGDSEESLLIDRLREVFEQHKIRFSVYGGDILYDLKQGKKSIKSIIGDMLKEFMLKNKFKAADVFAVLHIIDTDGCFIAEDDIIIEEKQKPLTYYHLENISVVNDNQKTRIAERNEQKSKNINIMRTAESILPNNIDYRMYYFSRNLEHVLFDNENPKKETKVLNVEHFIEHSQIPIEAFLKKYMVNTNETDHDAKYVESWTQIAQDTASLQRFTNVPLMFEFIQLNSGFE